MIDINDVATGLAALKNGLEIMRSVWAALPHGSDKDSLAKKIEERERAIQTAQRAVAIGHGAQADDEGVAIGYGARAGKQSVSIGYMAGGGRKREGGDNGE